MVKFVIVVFLFFGTLVAHGQNLSLGLGGRVSNQWVQNDTAFNFDIINANGDKLILKTIQNSVKLTNGLSFPIYARYTGKRNWWAQVNYGYETWRLGISAETTPTNTAIEAAVQAKIDESTSMLDLEDLRDAYLDEVLDENTYSLETFERIQYNRLTFAIGSSLNKRGLITFYYGGGFDFFTSSTIESYQGLVYEKEEVPLTHQILEAMPKLESVQFSPFLNLGIEKQNIRLGLDFSFFPGPVFGRHNVRNDTIYERYQDSRARANTRENDFGSQLVRNIASLGVTLNYTLFNQNFNQAISADKKNVLDPLVIGRYRQKPKLIQYG
ncbi:MAG: hypothetical protein AB8B74_01120, partial [Crocinitomicaceae bacterium]